MECNSQVIANFILPEINKLAVEAKSGSLAILFVSCGRPSHLTVAGGQIYTMKFFYISVYMLLLAAGSANTLSGVDSVDGSLYMPSVPGMPYILH